MSKKETLERLELIEADLRNRGVELITIEIMKSQIVEQIPNAWSIAAKAMGLSLADFYLALSGGCKLSIGDFFPLLTEAVQDESLPLSPDIQSPSTST